MNYRNLTTFLLVFFLCTPLALGEDQVRKKGPETSKEQKKGETEVYELKRMDSVTVTAEVAKKLKKERPFDDRIEIRRSKAKARKGVEIYKYVEGELYFVVDSNPQQTEAPDILKAESSPLVDCSEPLIDRICGGATWIYASCSCEGVYMPPNTISTSGGDFCFFERSNNEVNYSRCGGSCNGECKLRSWTITGNR